MIICDRWCWMLLHGCITCYRACVHGLMCLCFHACACGLPVRVCMCACVCACLCAWTMRVCAWTIRVCACTMCVCVLQNACVCVCNVYHRPHSMCDECRREISLSASRSISAGEIIFNLPAALHLTAPDDWDVLHGADVSGTGT